MPPRLPTLPGSGGLWAGGRRMCEAVLSVERGRMHVGLRTVGVPYMHMYVICGCVVPYVGGGALNR